MKRLIIAACCFAAILSGCQKETMDERIIRETQEFNTKECPKMLDMGTRMDSMHFDIESHTIQYVYTMVGDYDSPEIYNNENIAQFRQEIQKGMKNSISLKPYKDMGMNFRYTYYSGKTGNVLVDMKFTQEDYK